MGILDIGLNEILMVFIVALFVYAPQWLSEIARKIGSTYRNWRR